jgi:hypothetical protein
MSAKGSCACLVMRARRLITCRAATSWHAPPSVRGCEICCALEALRRYQITASMKISAHKRPDRDIPRWGWNHNGPIGHLPDLLCRRFAPQVTFADTKMMGLWVRRRCPPNGSKGGMLPVEARSCAAKTESYLLFQEYPFSHNLFHMVDHVGSKE